MIEYCSILCLGSMDFFASNRQQQQQQQLQQQEKNSSNRKSRTGIGYDPISGPMKNCPDIGYDIRMYGYRDICPVDSPDIGTCQESRCWSSKRAGPLQTWTFCETVRSWRSKGHPLEAGDCQSSTARR